MIDGAQLECQHRLEHTLFHLILRCWIPEIIRFLHRKVFWQYAPPKKSLNCPLLYAAKSLIAVLAFPKPRMHYPDQANGTPVLTLYPIIP